MKLESVVGAVAYPSAGVAAVVAIEVEVDNDEEVLALVACIVDADFPISCADFDSPSPDDDLGHRVEVIVG